MLEDKYKAIDVQTETQEEKNATHFRSYVCFCKHAGLWIRGISEPIVAAEYSTLYPLDDARLPSMDSYVARVRDSTLTTPPGIRDRFAAWGKEYLNVCLIRIRQMVRSIRGRTSKSQRSKDYRRF